MVSSDGTKQASSAADSATRPFAAAMVAFLIWGLFPIYLKLLQSVSALQVIAHRLVWGCILALLWLAVRGELAHVRRALAEPGTRWRLCISAVLISINWLIYVWGVNTDRIVETSLGYFINPLVNVVLGVVVLSERLNRTQWISVAFATAGVAYLTWTFGYLPWISLCLAISFGLYGLVRKVVQVDALAGFASETLLLLPIGVGYLVWCEIAGTGMGNNGLGATLLLMLGGPLTALPLVLFAYGARRIPYSTMGVVQYFAPTMQFLLGVLVYNEPFGGQRAVGFVLIWTALAIYAFDGLRRSRQSRLAAVSD
jgi:chloramphenicol-sensitive protein RarD